MTTLITHPGKFGDLVWALACVKAYCDKGEKVDMATSQYCRAILPLLESQAYIRSAFVYESWNVKFSAPVEPWDPQIPIKMYPRQLHLGMREWPSPDLFRYYPYLMRLEYGLDVQPNIEAPWIYLGNEKKTFIALVFSDEWVELKAGWILALIQAFPDERFVLLTHKGSRLFNEFRFPFVNFRTEVCGFLKMAEALSQAKLVITCNSVGHPLSVAVGSKVIVAEPEPMRRQPVFKSTYSKATYFDGINAFELIDKVQERLGK